MSIQVEGNEPLVEASTTSHDESETEIIGGQSRHPSGMKSCFKTCVAYLPIELTFVLTPLPRPTPSAYNPLDYSLRNKTGKPHTEVDSNPSPR